MIELAFLIATIFAGLIMLTPIVGITVYVITRPWLIAYRQRQQPVELYNSVNLYAPERPEPNATRGYTTGER